MRKIATLLVALGLTIGLLGAGVSATFTETVTAQTSVNVGTFNIMINTPGGVQNADGSSVTFTCPEIVSSAAGVCSQTFSIYNTGSIPANVSVEITTPPAAPFSSIYAASSLSPHVVPAGGEATFVGGIGWPELTNDQLGWSVSITYTVTASA